MGKLKKGPIVDDYGFIVGVFGLACGAIWLIGDEDGVCRGDSGKLLVVWLWTALPIKDVLDVVLDLLLYLIELLQFLHVFGVEMLVGSLAFEGLTDNLFSLGLILWGVVKFLEGGDGKAVIILVLAKNVLLLDDFLVVDEVVVGVIVVDVGVSALGLLADRAGTLHVPLLYYLLIEFAGNVIELSLLAPLKADRGRCVQTLQVFDVGVVEGGEVAEVVDGLNALIVYSLWE